MTTPGDGSTPRPADGDRAGPEGLHLERVLPRRKQTEHPRKYTAKALPATAQETVRGNEEAAATAPPKGTKIQITRKPMGAPATVLILCPVTPLTGESRECSSDKNSGNVDNRPMLRDQEATGNSHTRGQARSSERYLSTTTASVAPDNTLNDMTTVQLARNAGTPSWTYA